MDLPETRRLFPAPETCRVFQLHPAQVISLDACRARRAQPNRSVLESLGAGPRFHRNRPTVQFEPARR